MHHASHFCHTCSAVTNDRGKHAEQPLKLVVVKGCEEVQDVGKQRAEATQETCVLQRQLAQRLSTIENTGLSTIEWTA